MQNGLAPRWGRGDPADEGTWGKNTREHARLDTGAPVRVPLPISGLLATLGFLAERGDSPARVKEKLRTGMGGATAGGAQGADHAVARADHEKLGANAAAKWAVKVKSAMVAAFPSPCLIAANDRSRRVEREKEKDPLFRARVFVGGLLTWRIIS